MGYLHLVASTILGPSKHRLLVTTLRHTIIIDTSTFLLTPHMALITASSHYLKREKGAITTCQKKRDILIETYLTLELRLSTQ